MVIQVLPTLITLGNVLAGFLALSYVVDAWGRAAAPAARDLLWVKAATAIFVGMICDALDGKVARLTDAASAFGAELDSLADMITFGVAPALLAKSLAQTEFPGIHPKVTTVLAVVYALGAALRLARYNVESNRVTEPGHVTRVFRGLPSPGAAGVIASLVLLRQDGSFPALETPLAFTFLLAPPILGFLMISRFAFAHVMNRVFVGARSPVAIVVLLVSLFLVVEHPEASLAAIFVAYALSGPVTSLARATIGRPHWADDEEDDESVVAASDLSDADPLASSGTASDEGPKATAAPPGASESRGDARVAHDPTDRP